MLVLDCEPVDDMPIVDLRIRKGVRRHGVKLAVATSRPSSLDRNAATSIRFAPGGGEAFLLALSAAFDLGRRSEAERLAQAAGVEFDALRALVRALQAGEDVVVLYGERLVSGPRGAQAARALLDLAERLSLLGGREGAGLLCVPASPNGRGLAEAGVLPNAGPGFSETAPGRDAAAIAAAAREGELTALYLLHADPVTELPGRAGWEAALERATTVIAHANFLTDGVREHATVVFPAESYAEKDGTLTHPDGRLQRLRAAIGHPGDTRAEWSVIAELARRMGLDLGVLTGPMATAQLVAAVPFYAGLTLEEIGGKGVRWPARDAAGAFPAPEPEPSAEPSASDEAAQEPPPAPVAQRAPAPGHLPLDLERHRGARVARAALPAPGAARGDGARRRPAPRALPGRPRRRRLRRAGGRRDRHPARGHARGHRLPGDQRARGPAGGGAQGMSGLPLAEVGYYEPWWMQILKGIVIFAVGLQLVPVVLVVERKLLGRFQNRYGPNRVGPFGILQPMADIIKLITKEQFRPRTSIGWLFALAPLISIMTAVAAFAIIPFGDTVDIFGTKTGLYGLDVSIGPLYLFAFGAVAFYGIMLGGWASGSKYSFLGAMRAAAQLISYEVEPGPRPRRRGHDRGHAVAHRDRLRPGGHVVLHPAVRRVHHLPDGVVRGDQPPALRPRRGRRRAGAGLHDRVRRRALRLVLLRRVPQRARRRRAS